MNDLVNLTRDELIKKCYNQRELIKDLQSNIVKLSKEVALKDILIKNMKIGRKVTIYMQETLSYIEEVEYLKKIVRKYKEKYGE